METVGIRELKQQASELVRRVREEGHSIQISYHGKVVAMLIPVERQPSADKDTAWANLEQLAAEISAAWPEGVSAVEAVSEGRR